MILQLENSLDESGNAENERYEPKMKQNVFRLMLWHNNGLKVLGCHNRCEESGGSMPSRGFANLPFQIKIFTCYKLSFFFSLLRTNGVDLASC